MDKFIPKEKMSKKVRREFNNAKRRTWGEINPVTRKVPSKKIYNRKKVRLRDDDIFETNVFNLFNFFHKPQSNQMRG